MCPNVNKGVIESSCDASSSPVWLVQSASVDVSYGIESADMYAFQGLFGEWLPEARDTQACASSTSSQLTLEMLENDAYQSIVGEICSTEYCSYAPNGNLNCSIAQVALGSQQSKSEESLVRWNELPVNVLDSTFQVMRYSGLVQVIVKEFISLPVGMLCIMNAMAHDRSLTSLKQR